MGKMETVGGGINVRRGGMGGMLGSISLHLMGRLPRNWIKANLVLWIVGTAKSERYDDDGRL